MRRGLVGCLVVVIVLAFASGIHAQQTRIPSSYTRGATTSSPVVPSPMNQGKPASVIPQNVGPKPVYPNTAEQSGKKDARQTETQDKPKPEPVEAMEPITFARLGAAFTATGDVCDKTKARIYLMDKNDGKTLDIAQTWAYQVQTSKEYMVFEYPIAPGQQNGIQTTDLEDTDSFSFEHVQSGDCMFALFNGKVPILYLRDLLLMACEGGEDDTPSIVDYHDAGTKTCLYASFSRPYPGLVGWMKGMLGNKYNTTTNFDHMFRGKLATDNSAEAQAIKQAFESYLVNWKLKPAGK